MENSLYPGYIEMTYHSDYAPHTMTIPLKGWSPGVGAGDVEVWGGGTEPTQDSMEAFVALIAPFFPVTVSFDYYFVYHYADPDSDPVVRAGGQLNVDGSNATPGWAKATSSTFTFKTTLGGLVKTVLLDCGTGNSFDPVLFTDLAGASLAFVNFMIGDTCFIAGRDNGRPAFFLKVVNDLNDALRKQYHMD